MTFPTLTILLVAIFCYLDVPFVLSLQVDNAEMLQLKGETITWEDNAQMLQLKGETIALEDKAQTLRLKGEIIAREDNSTFPIQNAKRYYRMKCRLNDDWPMRVKSPVFLGNYPYLSKFTFELPEDQPLSCPSRHNSWWPGTDHNLRSNCPWRYSELSLGSNFYPSRVMEAHCLCTHCVDDAARKCMPVRQRIYVLTLAECEDKYYDMDSLWKRISTACESA